MANVNEIKKSFDAIINYPQQGNYTIDKLNVWLYNASAGLFKQRLGLPEQMEFSTGVPKIAYARTKKIHEDMNPFRKFKNVNLPNYEFVLSSVLPDDLLFETSVYYTTVVRKEDKVTQNKLSKCGCKEVTVEQIPEYKKYLGSVKFIEEDKWVDRANSVIIKKAIYCPFSTGWKFYFPITEPSHIRIEYLAKPIHPVWGFTTSDDAPVYNPLTSVDPEWDDTLIPELVARMVKEYGMFISDTTDVQFANERINTGN